MTDSVITLPSYDLVSPNKTNDLLPLLHRIRAESPVSWAPDIDSCVLTRHSDILAMLKDQRFDTANLTQGLDRLPLAVQEELLPLRQSMELWMGHTNEADHLRFQHLLKRYFTPSTVNGLRPRVRELTHQLLDAVEPAGRMEVVLDLAHPLPANVISEMLGMPASERARLRAWSHDITSIFRYADADSLRASQHSVLEMQDYLRTLVAERRRNPADDLISVLVAAERDGLVNEDEIVANCVLLLFAGHETTAGLIANGLVLLFENPDQLALLKSQPDLTPQAVEEMLRRGGPAAFVYRLSTEPVTVAGHAFPENQRFCLALVAGNHDPEVFPEPDRFDITRKANRHTSFGIGPFYCLGSALARVEADECFRILLDRLPDIRPAYRTPAWQPVTPLGRYLEELPVEF
jgi:cytochrome P450